MHRKRVYLDWAAAAPVSPRVNRSYRKTANVFGNPSSPHAEGRQANVLLTDARVRIARLAGVKQDAVIFTGGATEANAIAIEGQIRVLKKKGARPEALHVLYLPSAHASTRGCIAGLEKEGVQVEPLIVFGGMIDLAALKGQIRPETVLVALEAVCGETGARFDTRGVRQVLDHARKEGGTRIRMHADASQLPLVESFELTRIASDTLTLDAQKVGGVRGIGVVLAPRQVSIEPLMQGGGQERGLRPGTESSGLASAFACALEEAHETHASFALKARVQRDRLVERLTAAIAAVEVNGGKNTVPHILNVSLLGRDTDYVAALLDEAGFAISTRSACATDEEGSVAVRAYSNDPERASSTLRVSWGPTTTERELDRFTDALVRAVRFVDTNTV
ncbi:MAG: aminotransferase class V-fold PLP-dependent enzyme [Patescibacteria group bacterium]